MAGFLIWIVIIIAVVYANTQKSKKTGEKKQTSVGTQQRPPMASSGNQNGSYTGGASAKKQNGYDQWENFNRSGNAMKQQELKERLARKYNRPVSTEPDILARAKASAAEDFADNAGNNFGTSKTSGVENGMVDEEKRREMEIRRRMEERLAAQEDGESDIMKAVEDLMVKGPNMEMPFGRDFLAEGIDMLNRIQS